MPQSAKRAWLRFATWVSRTDWRIWAIILAMVIAILITAFCFWFGIWQNPATMGGAIFAAWAGGVALFVVVGLIVGIVSLVRPEEESFDSRARILFRRETGAHIDYIVRRITDTLEHYAESTYVTAIVQDYDPEEKKYFIRTTVKTVVRSYLDDVDTKYNSDIHFTDATAAPAGRAKNRLVYLNVGGAAVGVDEEFDASIKRNVETTILKDGACIVEYMSEIWLSADQEPNTYAPRRYTQSLSLGVGNLCKDCLSVKVLLKRSSANPTTVELPYGATTQTLAQAANIEPLVEAWSYHVLAP
jgi:hypothetical protein